MVSGSEKLPKGTIKTALPEHSWQRCFDCSKGLSIAMQQLSPLSYKFTPPTSLRYNNVINFLLAISQYLLL